MRARIETRPYPEPRAPRFGEGALTPGPGQRSGGLRQRPVSGTAQRSDNIYIPILGRTGLRSVGMEPYVLQFMSRPAHQEDIKAVGGSTERVAALVNNKRSALVTYRVPAGEAVALKVKEFLKRNTDAISIVIASQLASGDTNPILTFAAKAVGDGASLEDMVVMRAWRSPPHFRAQLLREAPGDSTVIQREYRRLVAAPADQRDSTALLIYICESHALAVEQQGQQMCTAGPLAVGPTVEGDGAASERALMASVIASFRDRGWGRFAAALMMDAPFASGTLAAPLPIYTYLHAVTTAFVCDAAYERANLLIAATDHYIQLVKGGAPVITVSSSGVQVPSQLCLVGLINMILAAANEFELACRRVRLCSQYQLQIPSSSSSGWLPGETALYQAAERLRQEQYSTDVIQKAIRSVTEAKVTLQMKYFELPPMCDTALERGVYAVGCTAIEMTLAGVRDSLAVSYLTNLAAREAREAWTKAHLYTVGLLPKSGVMVDKQGGFSPTGELVTNATARTTAQTTDDIRQTSASIASAISQLATDRIPGRAALDKDEAFKTLASVTMDLHQHCVTQCFADAQKSGPIWRWKERVLGAIKSNPQSPLYILLSNGGVGVKNLDAPQIPPQSLVSIRGEDRASITGHGTVVGGPDYQTDIGGGEPVYKVQVRKPDGTAAIEQYPVNRLEQLNETQKSNMSRIGIA